MPDITLPYRYRPRNYQVPCWNFFSTNVERKRGVVIAHRRWGKDKMGLNLLITQSQQRIGTYWHLFPFFAQGRSIIWNGVDSNNGMRFMDHFPPALVESQHQNEMRVHLKNGSVYQVVGADNVDRLVGTNPFGILLSEWSLCNPVVLDYLRPILNENNGWFLVITTIRGKNHAYRLAKKAEELQRLEPHRWFYTNQTVLDTRKEDGTRYVTDAHIDENRREGMSEAMVRQEFYNDPDSPLEGAYYGAEMKEADKAGRITSVAYEPKLPVKTAWDIGMRDSTAIWFIQEYGQERRVIDYYENSGESLKHYVKVLQSKPYIYAKHYGPHDITVREWTAGNSRLEAARHLGVKFSVTQKHSVEDGIEQVRSVLPSCWFDGTKCERGIDALRSYRKERANDSLARAGEDGVAPIFKDEPLHDWASHAASAFDTYAWNCKLKGMKDDAERWPAQTRTEDNYAYV